MFPKSKLMKKKKFTNRYKPLIITTGISGIVVWCMLLWTTSLEALQALQFFYGTYMATEVAYYTYIYAKVDKQYYGKVSSHTRAAMLLGKLVASVAAQLLIYYKIMDYYSLNYITLATQCIATIWAFMLPNVKTSLYFHRNKDSVINLEDPEDDTKLRKPSGLTLIWQHFISAYSNKKVLQWSIWYSVGLCGMYQVVTFVQMLWKEIEPEPVIAWNAAVDGIHTFLGAIFAIVAGYIHTGKLNSRKSLILLSVLSVMEGGAVLLATWSNNLYASYVGFIIFGSLYAFTITVASAEVARYLEEDSFGLIFGVNTFIALVLQTLLNILVVSGSVFYLDIIGQYTVYAFYFIVIGIIYFGFVVVEYFYTYKKVGSE